MDEAPAQPDTPHESAPAGTPDTQAAIDYEKRYNDLRPQYDRTAQEAAQLRAEMDRLNDAEYQRQLMAQWGYEVEDPGQQIGWEDPTEELRQQLQELQDWKSNLTQKEQEAQQLQQIEQSVDEQFRATAPDLDPATREWVTTRALNMDPREDGMPDIQGAYQAFVDWETERQKQWRASKRRAPQIAPGGTEATNAPNLDDPEQRKAWMAAQLADLNAG